MAPAHDASARPCGAVFTSETSPPPPPPPASSAGRGRRPRPPGPGRSPRGRPGRRRPAAPSARREASPRRSSGPPGRRAAFRRRREGAGPVRQRPPPRRASGCRPRAPGRAGRGIPRRGPRPARPAPSGPPGASASWSSSVPTSSTAPSTNSARRPGGCTTSRKRGRSGPAARHDERRTVVEHLAQRRLDGPKEAEQLFPAAPVALGRRLPGPGRGGTATRPADEPPRPPDSRSRGVLDPRREARNEPRNESPLRSFEEGDLTGAEREDEVAVPILEALQERLDVEAVGDDDPLGGSGPEPVGLEEPFGPEGREPVGTRGEDVGRLRETRERREELLHAAGVVPLAEEALGLTDQGPEPDRGLREVGTVPGKRQDRGRCTARLRGERRFWRSSGVGFFGMSESLRCRLENVSDARPDSRHSPVARRLGRVSIVRVWRLRPALIGLSSGGAVDEHGVPGDEPWPRAPRRLVVRRPDARPEREVRVRDRHDRDERLRAARPLRPADGVHGRPRNVLGDPGGLRLALPASRRGAVPGRLARSPPTDVAFSIARLKARPDLDIHRYVSAITRGPRRRPAHDRRALRTAGRPPLGPLFRLHPAEGDRRAPRERRRSSGPRRARAPTGSPSGARGNRSGSRLTRTTGAAPRRSRRSSSAS